MVESSTVADAAKKQLLAEARQALENGTVTAEQVIAKNIANARATLNAALKQATSLRDQALHWAQAAEMLQKADLATKDFSMPATPDPIPRAAATSAAAAAVSAAARGQLPPAALIAECMKTAVAALAVVTKCSELAAKTQHQTAPALMALARLATKQRKKVRKAARVAERAFYYMSQFAASHGTVLYCTPFCYCAIGVHALMSRLLLALVAVHHCCR
jgi:hypothetical protein